MRLTGRIEALERGAGNLKRWVRIIRRLGQSEDEAIALWEAEHGPTDECNILIVKIV